MFQDDDHVCDHCIDQEDVQEFIRESAVAKVCDYCDRTSEKNIAAPLDEVIDFIEEGILREWNDAADEPVMYISREGGYQMSETYLEDIFEIEGLYIDDDTLRQDIINGLPDNAWCQKDYGSLRPSEHYISLWDSFCKAVKYTTRYVFFQSDDTFDGDGFPVPVAKALDKIGEAVEDHGLLKTLKKDVFLWRARPHDENEFEPCSLELGTMRASLSRRGGRMHPLGIPMFYAAYDAKTAIVEASASYEELPETATISRWQPLRDLTVIDFSDLPDVPSIFNPDKWHNHHDLRFLHQFVHDVSKPLATENNELEYIPTQVVAEYIRRVLPKSMELPINGICYRSSHCPWGENVVLFCSSVECMSDEDFSRGHFDPPQLLRLEDHRVEDVAKVHREAEEEKERLRLAGK